MLGGLSTAMKLQYSEEKALQKLGISSFDCMTKDNIAAFSTVLPHMKPDIAKRALEQIPSFKELALELVGQYKDTIDRILSENAASEREFYNACNGILYALQDELGRDDIDSLERERIENQMIAVAAMIGEKDRESKNFKAIIGMVFGTVVTALGIAAIAAFAPRGETDKTADEDIVDVDIDMDDFSEIDLHDVSIDLNDNFFNDSKFF